MMDCYRSDCSGAVSPAFPHVRTVISQTDIGAAKESPRQNQQTLVPPVYAPSSRYDAEEMPFSHMLS